MKKIFTILCLLVATATIAQVSTDTLYVNQKKVSITKYVSVGVSMTNSEHFRVSNYASVESGFMYENIGLGFALGRGNLKGLGSKNDNLGSYFYEAKSSFGFPIGSVTGSVILGYGGYFNSSRMFTEYGIGMTYNYKSFGFNSSVTNWDGIVYLTPSVTYNF